MNEISILFYLLSKRSGHHQIGTTKEEILDKLNITGRNQDFILTELLIELAKYIEPIGLQIKFNPIDEHWYITFEKDISETFKANQFIGKPSLAATLFCIITSCFKNSGKAKVQEIKNLRKKKDIIPDLKKLSKLGYISISKNFDQVELTSLIGYQLDLHELYLSLAQK